MSALLVELDRGIVEFARASAARAGLSQIDVVEGDAASSDIYMRSIPADIALVCGVLGNIPDDEVANTVRNLSMLCRRGAGVIWTRHRIEPDLTPQIRQWFVESGFEELSFDAPDNPGRSGIGTARLVAAPVPFQPAFRFFSTFTR